jgi:hypothetical protein
MRNLSGLACTAAMTVALAVSAGLPGVGWAQGETQVSAPPPSPSLNSMPRWSEFPVAPTDVPKAADIKQRVDTQLALREQLRAQFYALPWDTFQPDAMAAAVHAQIDQAMLMPVDTPLTPDQLESLGAALRAKAAPPPVAN